MERRKYALFLISVYHIILYDIFHIRVLLFILFPSRFCITFFKDLPCHFILGKHIFMPL